MKCQTCADLGLDRSARPGDSVCLMHRLASNAAHILVLFDGTEIQRPTRRLARKEAHGSSRSRH